MKRSIPKTAVRLGLASAPIDLARDRASREYLVALMREFGGNVMRDAERARMERESLHRLLKRYGVGSEEFREEIEGPRTSRDPP